MFVLLIFLQYFFTELQCINDTSIDKDKKALRYGFHQIHECQDFEKAFKCIRKCLDKKFDVAYADKNCVCTCYIKKDKEKYRYLAMSGKGQTPPTTKIPGWAQPSIFQQDESEDDDPKHGDDVGHSPSPHKELSTATIGVDDGGENNNTNASGDGNNENAATSVASADGEAQTDGGDAVEESQADGDANADGDAAAEEEHKEGEADEAEEAPAEEEHAEEEGRKKI